MSNILPQRKILIITDGIYIWPSFKVRAFQYALNFKSSEHFIYDFYNRQSKLIERLIIFSRKRRYLIILSKLLWYLSNLIRAIKTKILFSKIQNYDIVYLIKNTDLSFQKKIYKKGVKIVYDVNDGLWLPSFGVKNFEEFLLNAHVIICENKCLETFVKKYNKNTFIVPDAPQIEDFIKIENEIGHLKRDNEKIVIGWVGSPRSADVIYYIAEELEELAAEYRNIELRLVGASVMIPRFERLSFSFVPTYTQDQMIREILKFDIGIFPQFNFEDAPLRGTLKAKLYMCGGIAAIAQNVGEMNELIQEGVNGFLANSRNEWKSKLKLLIENEHLRKSVGQAAKKEMELKFNRERIFSILENVFLQIEN